MKKQKSLTTLLADMAKLTKVIHNKEALVEEAKTLQLNMLRIQQGVFHKKDRVIIMFEGFDAAGKGGAIRAITERLDPRSVKVIPIGEPTEDEKGKPWLYRFWRDVPAPGEIVIFDRSWYGRVLVEKVDNLTPPDKLASAYDEINQFEAQLQNDGIVLIKIFLAISKDEQLVRFEDRLKDPYKQWKITMADIKARKQWNKYVKAVDQILVECSPATSPWNVILANSKRYTRKEVLSIVTTRLKFYKSWIEKAASKYPVKKFLKLLNKA